MIQSANPAPLKRFYHEWYRPDNMAVVAVGDVDPTRLVDPHSPALREDGRAGAPRPRPTIAVPPNDTTLVTISTDPELQYGSVEVLYKHPAQTMRTVADYRRRWWGGSIT